MNPYQEWLVELRKNKKQWEAFVKPGHTVVIAGPGSGKTRVLAMKIARLLRDEITPPRGIACLTYTRMMAKELESRIYSLGVSERPNIVVGTIHSFCLRYVVQPFCKLYDLEIPQPIRIAPSSLWDACLDIARRETTNQSYDPQNRQDRGFKTEITKYHLQNIDEPFQNWENKIFAQILSTHYELLKERSYVDFDLIIKNALALIRDQELVRQSLNAKFPWFAVDEYQDLGYPLFKIVTYMIDKTDTKLFAIGDPDQSIFDFAGTDPKYLLLLAQREDMQPVIELDRNYRATQEIVNVSKGILTPYTNYESVKEKNETDVICRIYECGRKQEVVRHVGKTVARLIKKFEASVRPHKIAVIHPWRQNEENTEGINAIAQALDDEGIYYTLDKHPLYDRSMLLIAWLENLGYWCLRGWQVGQDERKSHFAYEDLLMTWERITQKELGQVERDTDARLHLTSVLWELQGNDHRLGKWLEIIREKLDLDHALSEYKEFYPDDVEEFQKLFDLTRNGNLLGDLKLSTFANLNSTVQLTTIHSSKGMEFEIVILAGIERIWSNENGKRLLYVGATRAEREICFLYQTIWPPENPIPPKYIVDLLEHCSTFDYVAHHPLQSLLGTTSSITHE